MNTIWSAAEGFASGAALAHMKRVEDSVRQGQNHYLTAAHQSSQIWECLEQVQRILKAASDSPLNLPIRCVIALPPILLAYAAANQWGGPCFYWIYDQIGTVCQIASLVTSVTLVVFGNIAFGVASITCVGIGFLDRNGILPQEARRVIHLTTYPVFLITGLIAGSIFTQLFAIANLAMLAMNASLGAPSAPEMIPIQRATIAPEQLILLDHQSLELEPLHLRYNAVPPIPDIDIGIMNHLCKAIDWSAESHRRALDKKLAHDPRWRDRFQGRIAPDVYLKDQLSAFIDSIQNQTILEGEPVNYTDLHNYLKIIASRLPKLDELSRADILLKLAIDGGEYCGPGKFNTVSDAYLSVLSEAATPLPLEIKVLTHLQLQRIRIFQDLYKQASAASPFTETAAGVIDSLDIHNYNVCVNLIGREFGLPNQGASEDAAAHVDPVAITAVAQLPVKEHLYDIYTADFIIDSLQEAIGTPSLPLLEAYAWLRGWIGRLPVSDEEKTALGNELSSGQLYERSVEESYTRFVGDTLVTRKTLATRYVKIMLLEMGILKIPTI